MEAQQLYSPETERAILGCILIDNDILPGLDLNAEDFHLVKNRWVFESIMALAHRKDAIDYITICQELDRRKQLAEIGGPAYVMGFATAEVFTFNAESYARILREKTRRRALVGLANKIAQSAYDEATDIDAEIPGYVNGLVTASAVTKGARPISEAMREVLEEVEERYQNPSDIWGIPTGFPTFDRVTGGLQEGELTILAGMSGVGKSILGVELAAGLAQNAPGVIYSMEMKRRQVARRLVSGRARVSTTAMKSGRMKSDEVERVYQQIDCLSALPIQIADSQGWTTTSLRADLARLKAQYGIKWFLLDYLFLLKDGGKDENERTAAASAGLKYAVSELDLAGIAIHSLNKTGMGSSRTNAAGDDGLPLGLNDMRGSGQIVYDADMVCFLTRYNKDAIPANDQISERDRDNARVLWFGKGRELENPRQFIILTQLPGFPSFHEYTPEIRG